MRIQVIVFHFCIGLLLWTSCQTNTDTNEPIFDEDGNELIYDPVETKSNKPIPEGTKDIIDLNSRKSRDGTRSYFNENGEPYSGIAIQLSKGASKAYLEYTMAEGKMIRLRGFFDSGKLERDFPFKDGISHGTLITYYENGNKSIEEEFENGKLSGSAKRWYENGNIFRDATFKEGKMIEEKNYAMDGTIKR